MNVKALLVLLQLAIAFQMAIALPYNLYTDVPYWVQEGAYAEYYGLFSVHNENASVWVNISAYFKFTVSAVGDFIHIDGIYNNTIVTYYETEGTKYVISNQTELSYKLDRETGMTVENETYSLFFIGKKVNVGDSISVNGVPSTVEEETYIETKASGWESRKAIKVVMTQNNTVFYLYYDAEAKILLGMDIIYCSNCGGNSPILQVRMTTTNIQPPSTIIQFILLFENPLFLIILVVLIVILALVIYIKRALSSPYTSKGTIRVMPGVERLR